METAVEVTPEDLAKDLQEMVGSSIMVKTSDDRIRVGDLLEKNKTYQKNVIKYWEKLKATAYSAHQDVCAKEKALLGPAKAWFKDAKTACIVYEEEQGRLRKVEQARLEAEAIKREEDARKAEAEALQDQAEAAEKSGDTEEAEAKIEEAAQVESEPVYTPTFIVPRTAPKVEGQFYTTIYTAEVFNLTSLIKGVLSGRAPVMAITINQRFLDQTARSMKDTMNIAGVKLIKTKGMSVGSR